MSIEQGSGRREALHNYLRGNVNVEEDSEFSRDAFQSYFGDMKPEEFYTALKGDSQDCQVSLRLYSEDILYVTVDRTLPDGAVVKEEREMYRDGKFVMRYDENFGDQGGWAQVYKAAGIEEENVQLAFGPNTVYDAARAGHELELTTASKQELIKRLDPSVFEQLGLDPDQPVTVDQIDSEMVRKIAALDEPKLHFYVDKKIDKLITPGQAILSHLRASGTLSANDEGEYPQMADYQPPARIPRPYEAPSFQNDSDLYAQYWRNSGEANGFDVDISRYIPPRRAMEGTLLETPQLIFNRLQNGLSFVPDEDGKRPSLEVWMEDPGDGRAGTGIVTLLVCGRIKEGEAQDDVEMEIRMNLADKTAYIQTVELGPQLQGKGVGNQLLMNVQEMCTEMGIQETRLDAATLGETTRGGSFYWLEKGYTPDDPETVLSMLDEMQDRIQGNSEAVSLVPTHEREIAPTTDKKPEKRFQPFKPVRQFIRNRFGRGEQLETTPPPETTTTFTDTQTNILRAVNHDINLMRRYVQDYSLEGQELKHLTANFFQHIRDVGRTQTFTTTIKDGEPQEIRLDHALLIHQEWSGSLDRRDPVQNARYQASVDAVNRTRTTTQQQQGRTQTRIPESPGNTTRTESRVPLTPSMAG